MPSIDTHERILKNAALHPSGIPYANAAQLSRQNEAIKSNIYRRNEAKLASIGNPGPFPKELKKRPRRGHDLGRTTYTADFEMIEMRTGASDSAPKAERLRAINPKL